MVQIKLCLLFYSQHLIIEGDGWPDSKIAINKGRSPLFFLDGCSKTIGKNVNRIPSSRQTQGHECSLGVRQIMDCWPIFQAISLQ